ncbi:aldehyde dehydrogenase family protein [Hyphobacterium sp. CCMP332]|uniref:aldehyde dehydrogenase family protein n=1 Tax=Hyphobacterium sp. CCMP332 TaxID=2749086 RepID=UPI002107FF0A|nr:aldehyde dehydrogenase family protein [Hyphobacterium sp. CCMP332]
MAASEGDVDAAFNAARTAFSGWARTPLADRVAVVERFGELLVARKDEVAKLIARETGKPLWDCLGEGAAMAGKITISIKAYHDRTGETQARWISGLQSSATNRLG